jgi:dTMP kinase
MKLGFFITLDGIDGCGKSTQCRLLADWLREQGREVVACSDPGGTAVGQVIRELLLDHRRDMSLSCEALLFMASRAQLVSEVIRPALDAGKIVISDRFLLANVVYQGHAGGLDVDLLCQAGRLSTGGLEPDLTIVLDLPLAAATGRPKASLDRLERRPAEYHEKVRQGFLTEARKRPDRIKVIDASRPLDEVQQAIRGHIPESCRGPAQPIA